MAQLGVQAIMNTHPCYHPCLQSPLNAERFAAAVAAYKQGKERQHDAEEHHVEDSLEVEERVCSEEDTGGEDEEEAEAAEVPILTLTDIASDERKRKRGPARQSEEHHEREQREQVHAQYKSKVPNAMQAELTYTSNMYNLYKVQALSGLVCGMEPIVKFNKVGQ